MRRLAALLLVVSACQDKSAPPAKVPPDFATGPAPANPPATAPAIAELSQRYLDGLFKAKPHLATFMGDHRFDGALPDFSEDAIAAREKELTALEAEVRATAPVTIDDRVDRDVLRDGIALELLYLREIRDWEWDPRISDSYPYYDPREIVAGRISDIMHGDFADEATRKKSVVAQLEALPKFLAQLQQALNKPKGKRKTPKVYAEHAIKENRGRVELFRSEVRAFVKGDAAGEAALGNAIAALEAYQGFLEKQLLGAADGDWRLGKELYEKKFPLALQTERAPAAAAAEAEESFKTTKAELVEVSKKLHAKLWPKKAIGKTPDVEIIRSVKDEISKKHAKPEELVEAHGKNLDQMRAFIEQHDLVGLPPKETLTVQPMPLFKRGSSAAEYLAPGILERRPSFRATYYVDPIDPTWNKERVESYLRGQNDYEVQLVAMHEAYPGHHTQFFYARKNLNALRATLWNAAMVEGWAVYAEGLMVTSGWGGDDNDRFRFYDLRGQMITATNTLIDVKLQSGTMTDEEAVRFMVEEGFQEKAMAEKKLLRAKLDSTQLAQYFLGLSEIRALERDYRARVGAGFKQRTFNEALIGRGSIAVKYLRDYLLAAP
jgi:uncharacterized protein (DUF885 family)